MTDPSDFRLTWLWRHAFVNSSPDVTQAEQDYFRDRYLAMREKAGVLVSQIEKSMPGLTVHDLTHVDALWETASLVAEGAITVSAAEAFVFGAGVLLHDSAMSLAAYPKGLSDLKETTAWKDAVTAMLGDTKDDAKSVDNPPEDIVRRATPEVLRQLHAQQAENLPKQGWTLSNGEVVYLIDDPELRFFYAESIGKIAHSHWWPISRVEQELSEDLGAFPNRTKSRIDRVKIACLLRIADALHLDQRRAPRFLRALLQPQDVSAEHWTFQERLAVPHIEHEAVVFTAGAPFCVADADAWWLAYDTISAVDRELQDVDRLMQSRRSPPFRARKVKGAGSPESFARTIPTSGWRPVDTQLRISDIPKVVETLGGAKLYGDDPTVVLRELIQNSADAVQARRRYQSRGAAWGTITVALVKNDDGDWLTVEDNGVGMSEQVLTGPLVDFGTSFWRSALAAQEFPGLIAKGMNPIGRYGIGFFSVFMIGAVVRVVSRRFDRGEETARVLEFRDGTASRPILANADRGQAPIDGGTRVEILLKTAPGGKGGLLQASRHGEYSLTLRQLVASIAPAVDVSIDVQENGTLTSSVQRGDWLELEETELQARLDPVPITLTRTDDIKSSRSAMRPMFASDGSTPVGRAYIRPTLNFFGGGGGRITVGGLRAGSLSNVQGLVVGETLTAARNSAIPVVSKEELARWATEQAGIIAGSKMDEATKAMCAEVVLECGGDLDGLPVVCLGQDEWLNVAQLKVHLADVDEIAISFEGEFSYDEDEDEVLPREFKREFEINEDIMVVPQHDGSILTVDRISWPRSISGKPPSRDSHLAAVVREVIYSTWGDASHDTESREIGCVNDTPIVRQIDVFQRAQTPANNEEPVSNTESMR